MLSSLQSMCISDHETNSSTRIFPDHFGRLRYVRSARQVVAGLALLGLFLSAQAWGKNSDFLIESWQDHEGIPESSALAVAQSPDGYLWVGSPEGLLRFNGISFSRADTFTDLTRLGGFVTFLQTDRSGRLWAGGENRVAFYDHGIWQGIKGTNIAVRSVAEADDGQVLIGGTEGQLYTVIAGKVENLRPPDGLKPSGVFCMTDAKDGKVWLANRGFIGRLTPAGWARLGPTNPIAKPVLATAAQAGGLWVYTPGELRRYQTNGTTTVFPAPDLDQPRAIIEDRAGTIWIASISTGLVHLRPGGEGFTISATNGLSQTAVRCLLEDREGNLWAGGSLNGLNRFKPRQFVTIGQAEGLPDTVVRTVTERSPGEIIIGTHGGGLARIQAGKVTVEHPVKPDSLGQYVWSLTPDRSGRLWMGTFNDGLFVQENGIWHPFPMPTAMGGSIVRVMEDSRGRIWAGGVGGLGIIESKAVMRCFTNTVIADYAITSLAEDAKSHTMWIGTYAHGVFQMDSDNFTNITKLKGLPGERISSLTLDDDGYLWIGIFEHGLASFHKGKTMFVGPPQGLRAETIGSILDDGHGWFWLGTTHGILRVARNELHRVAQTGNPAAVFNVFNGSDGLGSEYCVEGYQPNALRDSTGHLWFGTDRGVVTVDPTQLRLNSVPPPVVIERVSFTDHAGTNHVIRDPHADQVIIPAGSIDLAFHFAGLSFTAPEKVSFKYQLEGANKNWVSLGNQRELHFREMAPGHYVLHLTAANNDGVWNETGTALAFVIKPFLWQTLWFRLLVLIAVAGGGGLAVWRITRQQFQRHIQQLQQQRKFEQERARLATVMENTSDLVVFADHEGQLIHINPAGRKLIGLADEENVNALKLAQLQTRANAEEVANTGIPAARQRGTWEGETTLRHRDGREIPVSLVLIVHKNAEGQDSFISAIARDITERKRAEEALRFVGRRLSLIAQMTEDVLGNATAAEMAQRLAKQVMDVFAVDACVIRSLQDNQLVLLGACGVPADQLPPSLPIFGLADIMLKSRAPLIISDIREHPLTKNIANPSPGGFSFRAFAGVPLEVAGEIVGLLGIYICQGPHEFLPVDTEHLQIVANHVAISLANERHFKSTQAKNEQLELLIAERKKAEAELQRREKYFRSLIEHASDSITVINPQAVITYQSSSGERILGYSTEVILGRSVLELVHPDDLLKAQASLNQSLVQLDVPVTLTARLRHADGSWRTIEAVGTSIQTDAGEKQIILNSRDVTENLKLEEQFRQAQKMEAVGRLSGGVAHDFNNILTVIQGNVDFLRHSEKLSPPGQEALTDIAQGTDRAAALTRQLLAFSRRQTMQPANLDLNQVVTQMARMLQRILGEDIEMHLHYTAQPVFVRADAGMLEQVLMNLVVNSRDAMPQGGRLVVETSVAEFDAAAVAQNPQRRAGAFVCLSVSDNGGGIPADLMSRIFEPFFTTKDVGKGTGLGLATVYGIVEQHHGWVNVTSEIGQGTIFRIYLPRLAVTKVPEPANPNVAKVQGGTETILLVEDEAPLRMLAKKYLGRQGYRIIEAASGAQALKLWPECKDQIALVVTDMVMPGGVSGRELAQHLRRDVPGLKIIYTSGYSTDIAGKDFPLQEGVNFLPKPFNPADLARLVRKTIDQPASFNAPAINGSPE